MVSMNHYGLQAMEHWRTHRPTEFAELDNPQEFFTQLGQELAAEIDQRQMELEQQTPAGEDYLAEFGRQQGTRSQAEDLVLRRKVFDLPQPTEPESDLVS